MNFQFEPRRPIYLQIMEEIKRRSLTGEYPLGSKLPSVREMSNEMGVNPNTMARAYMELEREGFLSTKRGQGSFVTEHKARIETERLKLTEASTKKFVSEIRGLDLDKDQIQGLISELKGKLR